MKIKPVVVGVLMGLLATSYASFTPVYAADDEMDATEAMQLAENDVQSGAAMSQDGMTTDKSDAKSDDSSSDGDDSGASSNDSGSSDEATPDMATGDDDY